MTHFLLASGSPRRHELFALLGLPFNTTSADVDEFPREGEAPAQMVRRLSQSKASAVGMTMQSGTGMPDGIARSAPPYWPDTTIVIAADTIVSLDGVPLGKPADNADAWGILRTLRGRTHQVHTAITLLDTRTGPSVTDLATTDVPMRNYSDDEIAAYIATGDPLDKAGAYAIQHDGFHPVAEMCGCFANVMGLPLCHLARMLCALGLELPADVPAACQSHIHYECPVFAAILAHHDG